MQPQTTPELQQFQNSLSTIDPQQTLRVGFGTPDLQRCIQMATDFGVDVPPLTDMQHATDTIHRSILFFDLTGTLTWYVPAETTHLADPVYVFRARGGNYHVVHRLFHAPHTVTVTDYGLLLQTIGRQLCNLFNAGIIHTDPLHIRLLSTHPVLRALRNACAGQIQDQDTTKNSCLVLCIFASLHEAVSATTGLSHPRRQVCIAADTGITSVYPEQDVQPDANPLLLLRANNNGLMFVQPRPI